MWRPRGVRDNVLVYSFKDILFIFDRLLEEGKLQEAESEKLRLEQLQRERRKKREEESAHYSPRWFM